MDAPVQALGSFRIDIPLPDNAAESRLDVAAWAAKPVVQVEVPKGSIEIVAPEQAHDPPTKPNAFRKSGRTAQQPGGFGKLVGLSLRLPGVAALLALLGRLGIHALRLRGMG